MLDFLVILTKGGFRLWCFPASIELFRISINTFLKSLILKENAGHTPFIHESRAMKVLLDNTHNLIFIAAYQSVLPLTYVDKFLKAISTEFIAKYRDELTNDHIVLINDDFYPVYASTLKSVEEEHRVLRSSAKSMRRFEESEKSQKSVASMIISRDKKQNKKTTNVKKTDNVIGENNENSDPKAAVDEESIEEKRLRLTQKMKTLKKSKDSTSPTSSPLQKPNGKRVKEGRRWNNAATGEEAAALDFSNPIAVDENNKEKITNPISNAEALQLAGLRGTMKDELNEVHVSSDEENLEDEATFVSESDISSDVNNDINGTLVNRSPDGKDENYSQELKTTNGTSKTGGGLVMSLLRGLRITGSANGRLLTSDDIAPSLEQLRDRLVAKNVAMEIAERVCDTVSERLVGSPLGAFERMSTRVRASLEEVCSRVLISGRRVDVLRDAMDARSHGRPYTIVFCGVNGVGKSTNLAKIAFWLIEQNFRVLIAACDTFRSGAVEQLRTHVHKLNYIHPPEQHGGKLMVELYEQGYGRDAASIARSAVNFASDNHIDVVLVDTAGRMQDNEPLMRALASLINVNQPDLVLFVGEALVGNEAVDQLVKFNQALIDHSCNDRPRTIDGIVLTKFDTVDDKVGAAISMAYISRQPIVFVGTGQTYADLCQLSVAAVVKALMK